MQTYFHWKVPVTMPARVISTVKWSWTEGTIREEISEPERIVEVSVSTRSADPEDARQNVAWLQRVSIDRVGVPGPPTEYRNNTAEPIHSHGYHALYGHPRDR